MRLRRPHLFYLLFTGAFLLPLCFGRVFLFRDALSYVIPLKQYTVREVLSLNLPLWNHLNGFGEPWMANPQTGVLYPFTYLFALPGPLAFHLYYLLPYTH